MQEVGQEDGGSQVSPASTTPLPQVTAPPLPPDPRTPPVCGAPPVAPPPVPDSPPVAGKPPAPPEPPDRVPAPPAPLNPDAPPGLPPSTGFDAALVPPCPPWPPVMEAVASASTLASPFVTLPASVLPGRPAPLMLQPRNETKTTGMKKTTANRCIGKPSVLEDQAYQIFGTRVRRSWAAAARVLSGDVGRPTRRIPGRAVQMRFGEGKLEATALW